MNPSWTEPAKCDRTVWNIQDFVYESQHLQAIERITVLNLFASRDVSSQALGRAIAAGSVPTLVGADTDWWMEKIIERVDKVIMACGKIPGGRTVEQRYLERMRDVKAMVTKLGQTALCVAETQGGYPVHARRWLEHRDSVLPAYSWAALDRLKSGRSG